MTDNKFILKLIGMINKASSKRQINSSIRCPVCWASLLEGNASDNSLHNKTFNKEEEQADWITWYYYGTKDKKGRKEEDSAFLDDEPIDLDEFGDSFFLIKEFKAPPRDSSGSSEEAKEILRTYIPDAFTYPEKKETVIRCPRCSSKQFSASPQKIQFINRFCHKQS